MKKKVFLISFIFLTVYSYSQNFSYGIIGGIQFNIIGNNNSMLGIISTDYSKATFGVYGEYQMNKKLGLKTTFITNNREFKQLNFGYNNNLPIYKASYLEFSPMLKWDFKEYKKGIYIVIGPKASLVTKIELEGENAKNDFKNTSFGAQIGVGYRLFKFIDLEAKLNSDFTAFSDIEIYRNSVYIEYKSFYFGAIITANIDLEKIIKINKMKSFQ